MKNERKLRLQNDEEQRLLIACDGGKTPYLKTPLILAIETGMRRGELLGLTWSDLSHNRRVITLDLTKNGESREVPLSQRAFDALVSWKVSANPDEPRIFPMSPGSLEQAWRRLLVRAGIEALRFCDR